MKWSIVAGRFLNFALAAALPKSWGLVHQSQVVFFDVNYPKSLWRQPTSSLHCLCPSPHKRPNQPLLCPQCGGAVTRTEMDANLIHDMRWRPKVLEHAINPNPHNTSCNYPTTSCYLFCASWSKIELSIWPSVDCIAQSTSKEVKNRSEHAQWIDIQ
jgi:hypothetical protein